MGNRAVSLAARDNWSGHPNLSLRPHAPNKGKGVLQRQIRRAFIAGGPVLTTPQIKAWTGDHGGGWPQATLWRDLMAVAEPIGRASTRGRPWFGGYGGPMVWLGMWVGMKVAEINESDQWGYSESVSEAGR